MKCSSRWIPAAWFLIAVAIPQLARGDDGQAALDEALQLKIKATTIEQLAEVATLCEQAIQKGLDADGELFARNLLTGSLYQRVEQLCRPVLDVPTPDPRWRLIRGVALRDLEKIIKYEKKYAEAYLLTARLQSLPDGDRNAARKSVAKALELLKKDKKQISLAYLVRAPLQESAEERLADINRAIELDPSSMKALQARALHFLSEGKTEKGIADFEKMLETDGSNMMIQLAVAEALMNIKQFDKAMEHVNKVVTKRPSPVAFAMRAQLWILRNEYSKAVDDLTAALQIDPANVPMRLMRARLYLAEEKTDAAYEDVQQILSVQADHPTALEMRGSIHAARGDFDKALADMRKLRSRDGANVSWQLQTAIYANAAGQSKFAIKVYTDILAQDAENTLARRGRADAYLNVGRHAEAIADYNVALKKEPDDSGSLNNLAWVLATSPIVKVRDGQRAIELAQRSCELTEFKQAHILSTLAAAYAETGDFESALKWSGKAVELGEGEMKTQLQQELDSYREKKPWRESKTESSDADLPKKDAPSKASK